MIRNATHLPLLSQAHATTEFLGVSFDNLSANAAFQAVTLLMGKHEFSYVVTPNVDHVVALDATSDVIETRAYAEANLTLCDSRILSALARQSGLTLDPVPGSDLTRQILETASKGWRVAVIGGDDTLHNRIAALYPQNRWDFHRPPMGVRRNHPARIAIAAFVEAAEADIIFFAIGSPQSEICCYEIAQRGRARGVALCTGASLEFITGAKRRAPLWMQRASLEWLHRLMTEPRRLWRRYLVEGPKILRIWRRWKTVTAARHLAESGSTRFDGQ